MIADITTLSLRVGLRRRLLRFIAASGLGFLQARKYLAGAGFTVGCCAGCGAEPQPAGRRTKLYRFSFCHD